MSNSVSSDLFQNLIAMLADNYEMTSVDSAKAFKEGVHQYTQYVFLQDAVIDADVDWVINHEQQTNLLYNINRLYRYAVQNLTLAFDLSHPFWDYLSIEERRYYNYLTKEKYLSIKRSPLILQDFEEMTYSKHCLALVPLKGMEWLFTSKIPYERLVELFIPIFNGMQMMDDIDDFSKDAMSGQWNLIQYEVQKLIQEEGLVNDGSLDKFEERVFYASGICKQHSEYVLQNYQKALALSTELKLDKISAWLSQMIVEIEASIHFVDQMMAD